MSAALSQTHLRPSLSADGALLQAIDGVPETRGAGVVVVADGIVRTLRATPPGGVTVVYEVRPSPLATSRPSLAFSRTSATSPAMEWLNLGFNCVGSALAWIGVVGTAATVPVTGGMDAMGHGFSLGGVRWRRAVPAASRSSASGPC